jgi:hypothetical protein
LAQVLLSADKGWDTSQVATLLADKGEEPRENGVALDKHIPVHITYFTAEVDDDGKLVTQADVYGHEKRISLALDGRWGEIDKGTNHLARIEVAQQLDDAEARRSYWSTGSGAQGDGWGSGSSASRGTTANDIFRQNFGY